MSPESFIHIKSAKFPILPGEDEELINEGTYGQALAQYLAAELKERGYEMPLVCVEDWGWWVGVGGQPFPLGLCVYGFDDLAETQELCVSLSEKPRRIFSWRRLKFIDTTERVESLFADLKSLFEADPDIEVLGYPEEFPLG